MLSSTRPSSPMRIFRPAISTRCKSSRCIGPSSGCARSCSRRAVTPTRSRFVSRPRVQTTLSSSLTVRSASTNGDVRVTNVRSGMLVWTADSDGTRVAAPVVEVGSMEVPSGHLMVHLRLADGRELLASPGHRTSDGRPLGTLARGDKVDGSIVTTSELVPYAGERTYDVLPAGATGSYWANGILLASTL